MGDGQFGHGSGSKFPRVAKRQAAGTQWRQSLQVSPAYLDLIRSIILLVFRNRKQFLVQRRVTVDSLKMLAAKSVAARVKSKESLKKLEVPRALIKNLLVARENSWKTKDVIKVIDKKNLFHLKLFCLKDFRNFYFHDQPPEKIREMLQQIPEVVFYHVNKNQQVVRSEGKFEENHLGPLFRVEHIIANLPQMKNAFGCTKYEELEEYQEYEEPINESAESDVLTEGDVTAHIWRPW